MQDLSTVLLSLINVLLSLIVAELMVLIILIRQKKDWPIDEEHQSKVAFTNYSLWKYQDGKWRVVENLCRPGFHPGDPPSRPGDYPGEIVRKPSTRNP